MIKKAALFIGPLLFLILLVLPVFPDDPMAQKVVAVAAWMIVWWLTETVSISVTALIPVVVFPLIGAMDIGQTASHYASPIVFLFFGGFVMALALEKVNLHKRLALAIIRRTGTAPDRVVLGFMIATAFLSMWISNTASTVVMLPIALSVITLLMNDEDGFTQKDSFFALSIMLGIAFSANIGGIATLIGTPPNSVLAGFMQNEYNVEISFLNWMLMGLPFSIIMLFVCYWVLVKWIYPSSLKKIDNAKALIDGEIHKLGPIRREEKLVIAIFLAAILLWIFKNGFNKLTDLVYFTDAGISLLAAFALFTIPYQLKSQKRILIWQDTVRLPWGILILFGGGLALANGLAEAGIIDMIGKAVTDHQGTSIILVTSFLIFIMLFMTELMSNVALVAIFVPVVAGIALGLDADMMHLCVPIAMASSCAFMLPMATPPNAIVFASGHVKVFQMAKAGVVLNLISVLLLIFFTRYIIPLIF